MKLRRPLDFCAVTDHAEYIGEMYSMMTPGAPGYDHEATTAIRNADTYETAMGLFTKYVADNNRGANPQHPEFYQGPETTKSGWQEIQEATEKYYEPGKFTTFHAIEWSAAPGGANLHRNVIFRTNKVTEVPMSSYEIPREEALWEWLQQENETGHTVLAIPHNSNASKGLMFNENDSEGNPITAEYARTRQEYEPLIEMMQIKGNSEVVPRFWPNDEFAGFENASSMEKYSGRTFMKKNFVRYGLEKGLEYQEKLGVNPYKYGFVGGTDNHNGLPSNVEEDNYKVGSHGLADISAENRATKAVDGWAEAYDINPGALAAVWAPANTREDLWDAMKARETFATSGPRLKVRLFGGYDYQDEYANSKAMVEDGYAMGVPMGNDLAKAPSWASSSNWYPDWVLIHNIWTIGAGFKRAGFDIGVVFAQQTNGDLVDVLDPKDLEFIGNGFDATGLEIFARYGLEKWGFLAGFNYYDPKIKEGTIINPDYQIQNYFFGAEYFLLETGKIYAEWRFDNSVGPNGIEGFNVFTLGLRFDFGFDFTKEL